MQNLVFALVFVNLIKLLNFKLKENRQHKEHLKNSFKGIYCVLPTTNDEAGAFLEMTKQRCMYA